MNDSKLNRTNIYLTEHQKVRMRGIQQSTGIKPSEFVRRAIDELLEKEERKLLGENAKH